jgi:hypothetical protein
MSATEIKPLRISSLRSCPRMAAYEGMGTPGREPYDRERRILFSGHRIGRDYLDMLEEGAGIPIIREKKVEWEYGIGHEDGFIPSTGTVLEILSSASPDGMMRSKLLQLVLYMEHDEEATNGALLMVDPRDYTETRVIIMKGDERYQELLGEARARIEQIRAWRETGELPARVCGSPKDGQAWFCRHTETCVADWVPEDVPAYDGDAAEKVLELTQRWHSLKLQEVTHKTAASDVEAERKQIERELGTLLPPGERKVGPYVVKRSPRHRQNFALKRAQMDSRIPIDLLDEFTSESHWDVYSVEAVGGADWGDTPF